ncbi:mannan endo-1,4-beta-mannosidase 4-like [Magnolia sinica]|uniref:mannan endo-1,4-beta-mannosidase 4-like n=1 Tax=Magnolia sinica TaxID=86752 RepID=UPI00265B15AA|nr:mannan endo-1,4-beta-mannosidase 4-like [Magnolia sinica]
MLGRRAFYIFLFLVFFAFHGGNWVRAGGSFVTTSGTHFVMNGRPFYLNGFNAYWLMYMASDPSERGKVTSAFQEASAHGMTLARTWAFSDGGYRPLQYKPGFYNEDMFKGLDFVISEARKYGVYLILSLVNNFDDFGGRKQYVQWAREQGQYLSSDDDFYRNAVVKGYYKNHIKTILTRVNSVTGVAYKDDPTIFSWELMNEPRCQSDLSGNTIQDWIKEMAAYVKSIDSNHLLEVGMEGFYGESMPDRKQFNPGNYLFGTDFISNNQIPGIDFATIHAYPDQWIPNSNEQAQFDFLQSWLQAHFQDANTVLRKPILFTEFGKSSQIPGYTTSVRDNFLGIVYNIVYASASSGGPCGGGLFWQLFAQGMDNFRDGYEVIMAECPSTANIVAQQSHKISALN